LPCSFRRKTPPAALLLREATPGDVQRHLSASLFVGDTFLVRSVFDTAFPALLARVSAASLSASASASCPRPPLGGRVLGPRSLSDLSRRNRSYGYRRRSGRTFLVRSVFDTAFPALLARVSAASLSASASASCPRPPLGGRVLGPRSLSDLSRRNRSYGYRRRSGRTFLVRSVFDTAFPALLARVSAASLSASASASCPRPPLGGRVLGPRSPT
jgi:hypothetical protein